MGLIKGRNTLNCFGFHNQQLNELHSLLNQTAQNNMKKVLLLQDLSVCIQIGSYLWETSLNDLTPDEVFKTWCVLKDTPIHHDCFRHACSTYSERLMHRVNIRGILKGIF